jgi:transcription termination factor Rho
MSVLDRSALADSPLADLHAIASELGVDGFRRLRRDDLIDAILAQQGGEAAPAAPGADDEEPAERPRRRRGGRGRGSRAADDDEADAPARAPRGRGAREADDAEFEPEAPRRAARGRGARDEAEGDGGRRRERGARDEDDRGRRRERGARDEAEGDGGRRERGARDEAEDDGGRRRGREPRPAAEAGEAGERVVEGVVELLPNGSAFVRVAPPDASDDDAYLSAAQVRRCELVAGDRVSGPVRPPRRSERHPSVVRVETINGRPAGEISPEGVRFEELAAAFPSERLALGGEDPVVQAIDFVAPIGRGSRVTIVGPPRSGKSEALRRLAAALVEIEGLECSRVFVGVRPEEAGEEVQGLEQAAALSFTATPDAQAQAVEREIEQGKRIAARGGDVVVLIDTLEGLAPAAARRALAAARNLADHGSLTVIATAAAPLGGETTVIALDRELAGAGRFPAIDLLASGTLRPELLVGEEGAAAIAEALAEAL